MIFIRLMGGLGNQLFQFALGRALEHRGQQVQFDTSLLDNDRARRYLLGDLGLSVPRGVPNNTIPQIVEGSLRFRQDILDLRGDHVLVGYWQSEKYFSDIAIPLRREIFNSIENSNKTWETGTDILTCREKSCFIHVRRSDNLRPTSMLYHGLTDAHKSAYYQRAKQIMRERIPGVKFFVFSEAPGWCRRHMDEPDMVVVDHNLPSFTVASDFNLDRNSQGREVEDLYLLHLCRNAIIANSTFSWWGAWLNREQEGITIAPDPWFSAGDLDASDIIPERWEKVSTK